MKQVQDMLAMSQREGAAIALPGSPDEFHVGALRRMRLAEAALEERMVELTENVIAARLLARSYLNVARGFLDAVRRSRAIAQSELAQAQLYEARRAHEQARKCLSFARLCERRVDGMGFTCDWR